MNQVVLGKTGLVVSEVGFGGIPIMRLDLDQARELVRACLALGFTFFDTANQYGDSEAKLGAALGPVRERVVLATKTAARDAATAAGHLAQSLRDLATDHIDLYQLHNVSDQAALDQALAPGGAYEVAARAKAEGRVRHIGVTSHHPEVALRAIRTGLFETLQFPFNFVEDQPLQVLFPEARRLGLGIIGMKPLGGGLLEPAELCFKFLQAHPEMVPIPGLQAQAEAQEVADLYRRKPPLTEADRQAMAELKARLGARFCHRCGYCQPCPEGIDIPAVLLVPAQARRFPKARLVSLAGPRVATVENCQECGQCVEKCPYHLPVPEMLVEVREFFREFCRKEA
jgi:predicted aldo/keto reductase-like oxidoreductase